MNEGHSYPGRLIVVEGIDGSGKSTQIELLENYLRLKGFGVLRNAWNSSQEISPIIRKAKKKQILTPYAFSLLHAADFSYRYTHEIIPALNAGKVVLSDRYIYTSIARDCARGIPREWLMSNFRFAIRPDLTFFFPGRSRHGLRAHYTNARHQVLRSGNGHGTVSQSQGVLYSFPVARSFGVRRAREGTGLFHA